MSRPLGDTEDQYLTIAGKRIPIALDAAGRGHIRGTPRSSAISRILLGDSVQQSDAEQPQLLLSDQREGMGLQAYNEQEGLGKFRVSGWDTRFAGLLCLPPNPTQLGGLLPNTGTLAGYIWRVELIAGQPAVLPMFHGTGGTGQPARYNGAGTWATIATAIASFVTGYARFRGLYILVGNGDGAGTLLSSSDGVTWTAGAAGTLARCCAVHDNKLWTLAYQAVGQWKLRGQADPASTAKVDSDDTLVLGLAEEPFQLVAWQFGGFPALYVLTNQRLIRYDDRSLTFHTYDDFSNRAPAPTAPLGARPFVPQAAVGADGNLYVTYFNSGSQDRGDSVWQYSGNSNGEVGPNRQGGVPNANLFTLTHLAPAFHWTFGFASGRAGSGNFGRVLAMGPQLGWGTIQSDSAAEVLGGGYDGNGTVYVVYANRTVLATPVPDVADLPQNAAGRSYRPSITFTHRYGLSDLGLPNVPKLILGLEVHARSTAGVRNALDPNTTVTPKYALDGAASFTSLPALTSASTFPNRQAINGGLGVRCYDIEVALDGITSNGANSPLIEAVVVYYLPLFQVREEWEVSVVTDPLHPAARGRYGENEPYQYYGNSPEDLRKHLRDNAGASAANNYRAQVVAVSFGGGALENDSTLMNVTTAEFRIQSDEDPLFGRGVLTLAITNRTLSASG
jgi:hypothetical protein